MKNENGEFNPEADTKRLEGFSDGVFAIAITLLILEVKIPKGDDLIKAGGLYHYLFRLWPSYFSYGFTFIVIGIYWANHHNFFKLVKRTDHLFNLLNVGFLMFIAFLPFPSAILGDYILLPEHRQAAISFYSIGILLPSVFFLINWLYASNNYRLTDVHLDPSFIRYLTRLFFISNVLYLVSVVISFFYPLVSLIIITLLAMVYFLPPRKPVYIKNTDT